MRRTSIRRLILALGLTLPLGVSTADAAKGVKKTTPTGPQVVTGVVMSIIPNKTGGGTFHLKTVQPHRIMGTVSPSTNTTGKIPQHEFNVTTATRFEQYNGTTGGVVNAAALRPGSRVRVQAVGQQAQRVQIMTARRSTGSVMRHRTSQYHPYHSPHRRR